LIDRLSASPEHARELQRVFDVILMQRRRPKYVQNPEWQAFLYKSFLANKPWDELAREVLGADGSDPATRAAARFYLDREGEVNEITSDVGRIFLGVNLQCAQCHNHPNVDDWKQRHYHGIAAFLVRGYVFGTDPAKAVYAEKADGDVKYESVFEVRDKTSPGPKMTLPRILNGAAVEEPRFDYGQEYLVAPAKDVRPVPLYSRRAELGAALASSANPRFARAIANRMWALIFGRGLVHPFDYDHSDNPPSHPELLDLLGADLVARNFDIKGFLRELTLSQTYQRSTRHPSATDKELPEDALFAQAILKPLTAEQLAQAMMQATGFTDVQRAALGANPTEEALYQKLVGQEEQFVLLFGGRPGKLEKDFESTVEQVLFLANDPGVQGWLQPAEGNLTARLAKVPSVDNQAFADELYLSVFNRPPTAEETQEAADYLTERGAERPLAIQELVWALLTSAEFRFNH
jgi:hypothetical protein